MQLPDSLFQLKGRKSLWSSLVLTTLIVYFTEGQHGPWSVAFRYLYFIPITLAAYFHGRALGMAVSLLCTSLFLPILMQQLVAEGLSSNTAELIGTLILFNVGAWVTGAVGGVQRREKMFYQKLNQLGELLDQETKVDRLLSVSLERSLQVTGAEVGRILLRNPEHDYFLALDSASPQLRIIPAKTATEPTTTSGAGVAGPQPLDRWLIARNRALVSNQIQTDPRFLHPDGGSQTINSIVAAPIRLREDAIGLIMVANSQDGPFESQDLHMLEAISDRTAVAVERAWLYEAEQTKRRAADTLVEVSQLVGSTLELNEVLDLVLDCLTEVVDYDCASIQLFANGDLRYALGRGTGSQTLAQHTGLEGFGTTQHVLRTKTPLVIADTQQYPGWITVPGVEYVRSWLGAPILIKDKVIGLLAVRKAEPNYYGPEGAQLVFALASQVAIAIDNARLYEETRRRVDELEALRRTSLHLTSSLDLTAVLDSITESALALVEATDCHIYLYDEASETFTFGSALWDDGRREPAVKKPRRDGLTATVACTGQPVVINDVHHHPLYTTPDAPKGDLQAIAGFPLRRAGRVVGVFTIAFCQPHTLREEELRVLGLLADQAASAIENARLYAETKRRAEEMASLYEMGLATTSTLELDQQLQTLYNEIRQLFSPDTFAIVWYDSDEQEVTVELAVEEEQCLPKLRVPLNEGGLHGWVIKNSQPLLVKDMQSEAHKMSAEPKHLTQPARSWLGVPLVTKGRVIGAMSVQSFQPYAFDEDDQRLLVSIANQAAIAIENARLYEETSLLAITDGLTGLYNSRYFYHELESEILRSERYGHSCSLIFFDIDDFKAYNDRYGHLAGDDLLKEMGAILKEITRHPDTVARYGGEEFTIIQPETDQEKALLSAQRVWERVREREFCVADLGRQGRITISIGVATYPQDARTAKELVHAADMALYVAKREKDQVCVYERAQPYTSNSHYDVRSNDFSRLGRATSD